MELPLSIQYLDRSIIDARYHGGDTTDSLTDVQTPQNQPDVIDTCGEISSFLFLTAPMLRTTPIPNPNL